MDFLLNMHKYFIFLPKKNKQVVKNKHPKYMKYNVHTFTGGKMKYKYRNLD